LRRITPHSAVSISELAGAQRLRAMRRREEVGGDGGRFADDGGGAGAARRTARRRRRGSRVRRRARRIAPAEFEQRRQATQRPRREFGVEQAAVGVERDLVGAGAVPVRLHSDRLARAPRPGCGGERAVRVEDGRQRRFVAARQAGERSRRRGVHVEHHVAARLPRRHGPTAVRTHARDLGLHVGEQRAHRRRRRDGDAVGHDRHQQPERARVRAVAIAQRRAGGADGVARVRRREPLDEHQARTAVGDDVVLHEHELAALRSAAQQRRAGQRFTDAKARPQDDAAPARRRGVVRDVRRHQRRRDGRRPQQWPAGRIDREPAGVVGGDHGSERAGAAGFVERSLDDEPHDDVVARRVRKQRVRQPERFLPRRQPQRSASMVRGSAVHRRCCTRRQAGRSGPRAASRCCATRSHV
jgi:hypothetical protein